MVYSPAFTFSGGYLLGFFLCAGLRLGALRCFQAFLASSPCAASATSYHFSSSASLPWRTAFSRFARVVNLGLPVLASVANRSVKPTRLRRAAYFLSLVRSKTALFKPMVYSPAFTFASASASCAGSYCFRSAAPPRWRCVFSQFAPVVKLGFPVLASGSNCAVKPTRLRRAAYFRSLEK